MAEYPIGRECNEGECQWLAPKYSAPGANRQPSDYECIGKPSYWADCPRAVRARLAETYEHGKREGFSEGLEAAAKLSENMGMGCGYLRLAREIRALQAQPIPGLPLDVALDCQRPGAHGER